MRGNQTRRPKPSSGSGSGWTELDLAALLGKVFLIGSWKSYQELEENLSMPELLQTIESMQEKERQEKIFLASLQGVDIRGEQEEKGPTFDDIRLRAMGIEATTDDVVSLQGSLASEAGFGVGMGLGYSKEQ